MPYEWISNSTRPRTYFCSLCTHSGSHTFYVIMCLCYLLYPLVGHILLSSDLILLGVVQMPPISNPFRLEFHLCAPCLYLFGITYRLHSITCFMPHPSRTYPAIHIVAALPMIRNVVKHRIQSVSLNPDCQGLNPELYFLLAVTLGKIISPSLRILSWKKWKTVLTSKCYYENKR